MRELLEDTFQYLLEKSMIRNASLILFLIFTFLNTNTCFADFSYSSNDLKRDCEEALKLNADRDAKINNFRVGLCYGYIEGFTGSHTLLAQIRAGVDKPEDVEKNSLFCIQQGISRLEIAMTIVQYLDDHPENLRYSPSQTLMVALMKKFPCESKNQIKTETGSMRK
jgi:hypothetical protein